MKSLEMATSTAANNSSDSIGYESAGLAKLVEKNYNCAHCDKEFKSKDSLMNHKRQQHFNEDKRYACEICDHATNLKADLIQHSKTNDADRKFP